MTAYDRTIPMRRGLRTSAWRRRATPVGVVAALALLATVVLAGPGATRAQAAERTFTYTVSTQGSVQGDVDRFAAVAQQTLADPRGWSLGGTIAFRQVASGSDFDLVLASPQVVGNASPGCSSQWSCRVGRSVYINDDRWRFGTESWPHSLALYQQYVILHEVGHWLGVPHTDCPTPGRTAWVMQQQSISLQNCRANVWPVIAERERVAANQDVSVNWSGIEQRYRQLGRAGGPLGVPVSWEHPVDPGDGWYQHFAGSNGGSIFWSPQTGAWETHGAIRTRWAELGWVWGRMGYPLSDVTPVDPGDGSFQHFAGPHGASIFWSPQTGAWETHGAIRTKWADLGWVWGRLGYPTSGMAEVGDGGWYQHYAGAGGASIFWTAGTGAHAVNGPIRSRWAQEGWIWGAEALGYPVSDVYDVDGGSRADFQRGYIRLDASTGQTEVVRTG